MTGTGDSRTQNWRAPGRSSPWRFLLGVDVLLVGAFVWLGLGANAETAALPMISVGAGCAVFGLIAGSPIVPAVRRFTNEGRKTVRAFIAVVLIIPGLGAIVAGLVAASRG